MLNQFRHELIRVEMAWHVSAGAKQSVANVPNAAKIQGLFACISPASTSSLPPQPSA